MNDEFVKVTLTFPMRCDRPNRNGTVFTKEAIQNAFGSSDPQMPIVGQSGMRASEYDDRCTASTTPTYYLDYDEQNGVCEATVTGYLFEAGLNIKVNEMQNNKITDFDIVSVSILKKGE